MSRSVFTCIDAHTCGNPVRLIVEGAPVLQGVDMSEKRQFFLNKYDWMLKKIASQNFNINIQKICRIAGFDEIIQTDKFYGNKKVSKDIPRWKLITSHTARRTFVTLSAQRNVPHSLIMQVTGIKSVKTLQGYIKFDKERLNKSIIDAWS